MDQLDKAQQFTDRDLEAALSRRVPVAPVGSETASDCEECGLAIPSGRQIAVPGTKHCAECASLIESGLV